ncbi:cellulose synthase subunit BcsC-related outer membrane protein [Sodalis endosymbiont of Spalangia cameroni]|uniref:cellulose biosynthesis protein BcsC n=1 Tax=Sodalis praecaptivus TaxID=1239307 RepID=UPI0031F9088B
MKRVAKPIFAAWCAAGLSLYAAAACAADNSPAINALLQQAAYWHDKSNDDLARESLQKVLAVDENNADALYLLALYALQDGNQAQAARWRARLTAVSPNDTRLGSLDSANAVQAIPPEQLDNARRLAASGSAAQAVASYRVLFRDAAPPDSLAVEYYDTLAGIPSARPQAIAGLRARLQAQPNDSAARLALGRILTYDEASRREGIATLTPLAGTNRNADAALRQALLWLAPQAADKADYDRYIQRHPGDSALWQHFQQSVGGTEKGAGYAALNSGDIASARSRFEAVLTTNPNDGDALAGLGYIALRNNDFTSAENYLNQATKQGGANSAQWASLAQDAKFYGALNQAKAAAAAGNLSQALTLSAPLAQAEGDKGLAAALFRADVQRRQNDLSGAEQTYRTILSRDAQNKDAQLGLYYTLRQENKPRDAQQLLQTLPADERPREVAGNSVDPLRRQAQQALQAGNTPQALARLNEALQKQPTNVWVRLDMARILQQQGDSARAQGLMSAIAQRGAPVDNLYAAALFASETGRMATAAQWLAWIPEGRRNRAVRDLADRVRFHQQMADADDYRAQGNRTAALNTLRVLAQTPPSAPADVGNLAQRLQTLGDNTTAVSLVRTNLRQPIHGGIGDYAAQIGVLNQAGLTDEAAAFLNNPAIVAASTPAELSRLRQGAVINQADTLRERGQYAAAYNKLIVALQNDPQNTGLMLAMARLYQSGKMNAQAAKVFNYVLTREPQNTDAREGAVNTALAQGDIARARQLLDGMQGPRSVNRLILEARVAEAQGDHDQAMALLRSAKGRIIGMADTGNGAVPLVGGLQSADNPFGDDSRAATASARTGSNYGTVLPWQQADGATTAPVGVRLAPTPTATPETRTLTQINDLMNQVREKTATWAEGEVAVRSRDGENGLSNLTEVKAPLTISGAPVDNARLSLTVTPVSLDAGSSSGSANNRFGTGALQQGQRVANATAAAGATTSTTTTSTTTGSDGATSTTTTTTNTSTSDSINSGDYVADSSGAQKATGTEVNLALKGERYKVDVGSTPLGTDNELASWVGGVEWSPRLSNFSQLTFRAERRAVTDSLLAYVGARDAISGKHWGQVTRNGGSVQYAYDDGDIGLYAGLGAYSYLGDNVKSNTGINASSGVYFRPYRADGRELRSGVNLTWMAFDRNLSYFSYGQGGYFSPQNYISLSLPVDYIQTFDDWNLTLGGAIGYQSYNQDKSDYYPNDPDMQAEMASLVANGYADDAYYSGSSEHGVGYNVHAKGVYKINPQMSVGGQLSYDTFGDYSEGSAQLFLKYLLGGP